MKKKAKKREKVPTDGIELSKFILRKAVKEINKRVNMGVRLTGPDYNAMERLVKIETEEKSTSKRIQTVQGSIEKGLPLSRLRCFHKLQELVESKREDVALRACERLIDWSKEEEPPQEPYEIEDAEPKKQKVVSIERAIA